MSSCVSLKKCRDGAQLTTVLDTSLGFGPCYCNTMGINFAYAKGNERWRYVYLAVYDGKAPIDFSTGRVRYHTDAILDETAEMLSCSG